MQWSNLMETNFMVISCGGAPSPFQCARWGRRALPSKCWKVANWQVRCWISTANRLSNSWLIKSSCAQWSRLLRSKKQCLNYLKLMYRLKLAPKTGWTFVILCLQVTYSFLKYALQVFLVFTKKTEVNFKKHWTACWNVKGKSESEVAMRSNFGR